jgi:Xaa-Pro aminopeptidase
MEPNITAFEMELNVKLERIHELLGRSNLDAVLLERAENFAWATCGASSYINRADSLGAASLLITAEERYVITNNIESERLAQEEGLANQGWKFKVSPWYRAENAISELTRGMRLGADSHYPGAQDLSKEIGKIRSRLTPEEGARFRDLASLCAKGMQRAIESVRVGMTEFEIAGALSQEVENLGVQAIVNLVGVDERISAFRHPLPTAAPLRRYAMLVLCGRKGGLICSLTRLVHFGPMSEDLRRKAEAVAQVDAQMIAATRPGNTLSDVFGTAQASYAAAGYADEWQKHHQGGLAGYAPREVTAGPGSTQIIVAGQAFAWNPSITGVKSEDTILVGERTNEILTQMEDWPAIGVQVGDQTIQRPAILER